MEAKKMLNYSELKNNYYIEPLIFISVIFLVIRHFATVYMAAATVSYLLMVSGLVLRRNKFIHYKLMGSAVFIDVCLVLTLEITRNAINTALAFKLSPLQQLHIGVSTIATALYFPIVILGIIKYRKKSDEANNRAHKILGITAFVFRSLGFLLMFSMLGLNSVK